MLSNRLIILAMLMQILQPMVIYRPGAASDANFYPIQPIYSQIPAKNSTKRITGIPPIKRHSDETFRNFNNFGDRTQSAVSSLYNYLNRQTNNVSHNDILRPQKTSSTLKKVETRQPLVALGADQTQNTSNVELQVDTQQLMHPHMIQYSQLDQSSLSPHNPSLSYQPSMGYGQFMELPLENRQQLLANFYSQSYDPQSQPVLQTLPMSHPTFHPQHPVPTFLANRNPNKKLISTSLNEQPIDKPIRLATRNPNPISVKLPNYTSGQIAQDSRKQLSQSPEKKKKLLTKEQLVSLIDELKEFNSKQASAIQESLPVLSNDKQMSVTKIQNPLNLVTLEKNQSSSGDSEEVPEEENGKDHVDPESEAEKRRTTDDMAKFAKFLMSKEGANLKFQMGLDKDSPDDGDEDDERDILLETSKTTIKTEPKTSIHKWDKKHHEIAKEIDKLEDKLTGNAKLDHTAKPKRDEDFDEGDKARKRRDQNSKKISEMSESKRPDPPHHPTKKGVPDENFAKALIKQELLEDQLEADKKIKDELIAASIQQASAPIGDINRHHENHEYPLNNVSSLKSKYSDSEKRRDLTNLSNDLDRVRLSKATMRSRLKTPLEPIVNKVMGGKLGVRAERKYPGKLVLKGDRNASLEFDLPKKNPDTHTSRSTIGSDDNPTTSELVASQADPERGSNDNTQTIKLQQGKPLQEEYQVSQRVSDRLNKLSQNLDRYFNDGFLKEIESKSKIDDDGKIEKNDYHQTEPSDMTKSTHSRSKPIKRIRDRDFDVDVPIDGKRIHDNDSDEENDGDRRHRSKGHQRKPRASKTRKNIEGKSKHHVTKSYVDNSKRKTKKPSKHNTKLTNHTAVVKGLRKEVKPDRDDDESKVIRRDESSGRENVEFENYDKIGSNLDPVETESLDTPIGPDSDLEEPNLSSTDKMKISSGESNTSTRMREGKPKSGKFFEETEWH